MNHPEPRAAATLGLRWANRFAGSRDVPWHTHAETELVAVTRGRCRIQVGELTLIGGRGALFILPAKVPQYQRTTGAAGTTYLGFDKPNGLFNESARVLACDSREPALQWIEHLCDSHLSRPFLSQEVNRTILAGLLRRIEDIDASNGSLAQFHPAVRAARTWLEINLRERVTLGATARAAGVSASHLSALFATQCGAGPMRYLQRLRLERACSLLSDPYLRIKEVASACGYPDVNYFTRLFRRTLRVSPGRWRSLSGRRQQEKPTASLFATGRG